MRQREKAPQDSAHLARVPLPRSDGGSLPDVLTPEAIGAVVASPARLVATERVWASTRAGEEELQAVVARVAKNHRVPMVALVVVTPNRQTFLASVGLAVTATKAPDALAFCAHVVATGEPLLVPDATRHEVFSQNHLVHGGLIAGYAGVPVRDHEGFVVGTLCLVDDRPGRVSDEDLPGLVEQANVVADLLRARTRAAGLAHSLGIGEAATRLLGTQARVLEMVARGEPLHETLTVLAREVERAAPDARCSVLILDEATNTLRHGAGPSLPEEYLAAIDGAPVGPDVGSCGAAAATGRPVYAIDIGSDPRWRPYRSFALAHGLRACWSLPVLGKGQRVLGTFAIYYGEPREPDPEHVALVQAWADLASIALERDAAAHRLEHLALHDPLTGLPNRAALQHRLGEAATPLTVLFVDLDEFKLLNDGFGHAVGDAVLNEIARRVRALLDDDGQLYRFAGDEFVAVGRWNEANAIAMGERVLAAVRQPLLVGEQEMLLTASIGIFVGDDEGPSEQALSAADAAMFVAKGRGRNGWSLYDSSVGEAVRDRLALTAELREALALNELVVHYQPTVDLRTRSVAGVEALVRWPHRTRGLVSPAVFVPLAEDSGLVLELGEQVLRRACFDVAGLHDEHLTLSVNVSAKQLVDGRLVAIVAAALRESGLSADRLWLEITETAVMTDPRRAHATLLALAELGVRLSVDDFGTGHASLAYLKDLPVHELKVDRSFVAGLPNSEGDRAIVAAVLGLADAFGHEVVAEGVETEAQADALLGLGCRRAQGYLFARPMALEDLRRTLGQVPTRS